MLPHIRLQWYPYFGLGQLTEVTGMCLCPQKRSISQQRDKLPTHPVVWICILALTPPESITSVPSDIPSTSTHSLPQKSSSQIQHFQKQGVLAFCLGSAPVTWQQPGVPDSLWKGLLVPLRSLALALFMLYPLSSPSLFCLLLPRQFPYTCPK